MPPLQIILYVVFGVFPKENQDLEAQLPLKEGAPRARRPKLPKPMISFKVFGAFFVKKTWKIHEPSPMEGKEANGGRVVAASPPRKKEIKKERKEGGRQPAPPPERKNARKKGGGEPGPPRKERNKERKEGARPGPLQKERKE